MLKRTAIAALAVTAATFATAPAKADGFFFGFYGDRGGVGFYSGAPNYYAPRYVAPRPVRDVMTRREIRRSLRNRGFYDFRRIVRRGNDYVVVAKNRRGRLLRVRVNGFDGHIERRTVLARR